MLLKNGAIYRNMKAFAKYILLSTLLSVIFSYSGYAQFKVKGRIFNSITSEPLAFVTVMQDGTQNGTFTDIDGYFSLNLPDR